MATNSLTWYPTCRRCGVTFHNTNVQNLSCLCCKQTVIICMYCISYYNNAKLYDDYLYKYLFCSTKCRQIYDIIPQL